MASPDPSARYPTWLTGGTAAIALLSLFAAMYSYRATSAAAVAATDPYMINVQPDRVREAARQLPENAVAGYLSDLPFDGTPGQAAYFGVMYALAPRLVTRSADDAEWVIGNFSHPLDYAAAGAPHHLQVVSDFRNGIVLFRRGRQ